MSPSIVDVSIILVNWNSVKYLRECLASVYVHTSASAVSFEILVVDNASFDGCAEMLRNEFPDVIFIQSKQNLGFSKANNLAFQRSSGSAILFLNPDTLLLNSAIEMMYSMLRSMPRIGAVGCGVLNDDRSLQMHYVQAFPTILNQMLLSNFAKRLLPKSSLWGLRPLVEYNGKPAEVEAVMGSVLMVKRSVFEEIGLFDERYFMFAEDVDLCWSIQKHGYSIYYVREGSIIHHGGKSSDFQEETHFSAILQRESVTLFLAKTRGKFYAWLYKYAMGVSALGRLLLITTLIPFRTGEVNQRRLKLASRKSKKLLRWSLGLESITPNADSTLTAKPDNC